MPDQSTTHRLCAHCSQPLSRRQRQFCSSACHDDSRAARSIALFWNRVNKTASCWLWTGSTFRRGYGRITVRHQGKRVHRIAWVLATGEPIPNGMDVLHTCDVTNCLRNDEEGIYKVDGIEYVRRGHLFLGTSAINSRDMMAKGRRARGSRSGVAKLTDDIVLEILDNYANGPATQREMARRYNVSTQLISAIVCRKLWKHIQPTHTDSLC